MGTMKKIKGFYFLIVFLLSISSCKPSKTAYSFLDEEGNVIINLAFRHLSYPLFLKGENGLFFSKRIQVVFGLRNSQMKKNGMIQHIWQSGLLIVGKFG